MANVSDQFASELMSHSIDLARFEAHERDVLLRVFRGLEVELVEKLRQVDPTEPTLSVYQRQRAEKLLRLVRPAIRDSYTEMARTEAKDLKKLAIQEAALVKDLGAELVVDGLFSVGVPGATLRAMVDDLVIQGKPLRKWWSTQAQTTLTRYGDTVRAGVMKGDSITDMVRALRGTKEKQFTDGVFGQSRRNLTTLVQTSVQSVANQARLETFKANAGVLKGMEWLTALDAVVCPICRPLSEAAWTLDGKRMPGTTVAYPGPPPRHPRSRCHLLPVIRASRDLSKAKGPRFEASVQALDAVKKEAINGGLATDVSLATWLKAQPPAVQFRHIGPDRWIQWKQGKLSLTDTVSAATGQPMTLENLQRNVDIAGGPIDLDGLLKVGAKLDTAWQKSLGKEHVGLIAQQSKLKAELRQMMSKRQVNTQEYATTYRAWVDVRESVQAQHRQSLSAILREVRPLGDVEAHWTPGSRDNVKRAIADVPESLPSDWLQHSRQFGPMQGTIGPRGFYNFGTHEIHLTDSLAKRTSNAFHEFGHRFEQVVPDELEAERLFYQKRTHGSCRENRLQKLGPGFRADEIARPDKFVHAYMGKDYGGQAYELLSMGLESVFTGSYDLSNDPEFRRFILGVLAVL